MQLKTRQTVHNWARRLPLLLIAISALALAAFGATYILAPQSMPLLYSYASLYLGIMYFLFMLSLDAEMDPSKVNHVNGREALKNVLMVMGGAALNAPIMVAAYTNENIGFAPMFGVVLGLVLGRYLQTIIMPLYDDERRRMLLNRFEGMHLAYIWDTEAPLPATQQQLVDRVEADGQTMSLEELEELVEAFDDFFVELDEQTA